MPRKKPYSGKQKKKQLQEKRDKKKGDGSSSGRTNAGKCRNTTLQQQRALWFVIIQHVCRLDGLTKIKLIIIC